MARHFHVNIRTGDSWEESKHPRADNGQFGEGAGKAAPSKAAPASSGTVTGKNKEADFRALTKARNDAHKANRLWEAKETPERKADLAAANKVAMAAERAYEAAYGGTNVGAASAAQAATVKEKKATAPGKTFKQLNGKHTKPGGDHPDKIVVQDRQGHWTTMSREMGEHKIEQGDYRPVPAAELNKKTLL